MNAFPLNANKGTRLETSGEGKYLILNILHILFKSVYIPQDCDPLVMFWFSFPCCLYLYLCVYIYIYVCVCVYIYVLLTGSIMPETK